jgi:hypothetical protein
MPAGASTRRLILEASLKGGVITGTLADATGPARDFHGWIELSTALEAALATDARDDAPAPPELPEPTATSPV